MIVPLAARDVAAVAGAVLVLGAVASVIGTVIVPRKTGSRLTRLVASAVNGIFLVITRPVSSYRRRDRMLAGQAAVILLGQLAAWLIAFYVVTSLLAVLDSAALYLSLCPEAAPAVPTRLCLRAGLVCFGEVARSIGVNVPDEPSPDAGITLTYEEFLDAVTRLREVAFPLERAPEEAWPHFVGWRVNYEQAAYALASAVDAVPALWSGPRRRPATPMAPLRPRPGVTTE